jgi:hypothetical protein
MSFTLDYSKTGSAVISDSLDMSINEGSFTKGLNGFVFYQSNYIQRVLTIECRSPSQASSFVASAKIGSEFSYDGKTYYVKDVSLVENWGEAGANWTGASWRYNLTLVKEK